AIPGRHGGGIVGDAPEDDKKVDAGGRPGRTEFAGDGKDGCHPKKEKAEQDPAKDHQVDGKEAKSGGVKIAENAGVRLSEIPVRQFAVENAYRGLAEHALVVGDPSAAEIQTEVDGGENPNQEEDRERSPVRYEGGQQSDSFARHRIPLPGHKAR